jgi:hypothetical protein
MLPAPHLAEGREAAVRYQPAIGALNVCGDWYELVELPGGCLAVAVGDVVGHGLSAAGVMGQLRSALSAASRVSSGPAQRVGPRRRGGEHPGAARRRPDGHRPVVKLISWSKKTDEPATR